MTTPNEFNIGLCLAGAISAGAYTAGVLDYLIEALEDWETRRIRTTLLASSLASFKSHFLIR